MLPPLQAPNGDLLPQLLQLVSDILSLNKPPSFMAIVGVLAVVEKRFHILGFIVGQLSKNMTTEKSKPEVDHTSVNSKVNGNQLAVQAIIQNYRVEADAREAGDEQIKSELKQIMERGRRDSDTLFTAVGELSRSDKSQYIALAGHSTDINLLKNELAALQTQMILLFKNDAAMDGKLDAILTLLQPTPTSDGDTP